MGSFAAKTVWRGNTSNTYLPTDHLKHECLRGEVRAHAEAELHRTLTMPADQLSPVNVY